MFFFVFVFFCLDISSPKAPHLVSTGWTGRAVVDPPTPPPPFSSGALLLLCEGVHNRVRGWGEEVDLFNRDGLGDRSPANGRG